MTPMKSSLLILAVLSTAFFGELASASGDGVLKQPGGPAYLLDFVEQGIEDQPIFNTSVVTDPAIKTRMDVLFRGFTTAPTELIANKLSEIIAVDGILGRSLLDAMELLQWRLVRSEIVNVPDADSEIEFGSFQLIQLAVQRLQSVYVSREAWNLLPPEHQAGLVFHETVLAMLKPQAAPLPGWPQRPRNSLIARELVGYFFSYALSDRGPAGLPTMLEVNPENYGQGHLPFGGYPQQPLFGGSKFVARYAYIEDDTCSEKDLFLQSIDDAAKGICKDINRVGPFTVQAFAGSLQPKFDFIPGDLQPDVGYIKWALNGIGKCEKPEATAYLAKAPLHFTTMEKCIDELRAVLTKWKNGEQ